MPVSRVMSWFFDKIHKVRLELKEECELRSIDMHQNRTLPHNLEYTTSTPLCKVKLYLCLTN
jgi:hypothetical protein